MAGRSYPATMETATETDRRLTWSATMPNLDYSSGYSAPHSDITPASHHALSTAYDDLKKRYNDLQGRYTQAAKQLRDIQRRGSSPDLHAVTHGSPSRHHRSHHRHSTAVTLEEEPHNGDLGDLSLLSRERDLLERQVSELEHRLTEAGNQLADSEHETRQLREHVSRQEDDLRQNQRLVVRTESENEELRKRLTLVKRQLRISDTDKSGSSLGQPGIGGSVASIHQPQTSSAGSQASSLNSSLDVSSSFTGASMQSRSMVGQGPEGSVLGGELQNVLLTSSHVASEMKELKTVVQKQREVILMLIKRQNTEREAVKRRAEMQQARQEPQTCGIGARPKVRTGSSGSSSGVVSGGSSLPTSAGSSRSQLAQCTEDLMKEGRRVEEPLLRPQQHKDVTRSPDRSDRDRERAQRSSLHHRQAQQQQQQQGTRGEVTQERFSVPAMLAEPMGERVISGRRPKSPRAGGEDRPGGSREHDLESHYDDLQFGGGVSVTWERGSGGETNMEDLEPLLPSPPGRLARNESMEHLHDDSPPYDSVGDLNSETSGSTLCGTDQEAEYDPLDDGLAYRSVSSTASEIIENRYRGNVSPHRQQRSLNIDRNDPRLQPGSVAGAKQRSYDNATQNINLNSSPKDKMATSGSAVGNTQSTPGTGDQAFLNNNPLLAGTPKPVPQRNLYPTPGDARGGRTRPSPEPTPPPRRSSGRQPVEQASGEEQATLPNPPAPELRNCPVCNDDFPSTMAMDEFQQHVLECTGRTERICPMCDATFPDEVLQSEFERHVNEHFEDDTTLQFEVLPS